MFEVGQKVVCIDDKFTARVSEMFAELPKEGVTYTVRAVRLGRTNPGFLAPEVPREATVQLLLVELRNGADPAHNHRGELGFNAERFRALRRQPKGPQEEPEDEPYQDSAAYRGEEPGIRGVKRQGNFTHTNP